MLLQTFNFDIFQSSSILYKLNIIVYFSFSKFHISKISKTNLITNKTHFTQTHLYTSFNKH